MQFGQLKRREFIALLGGAAVTWPLAARAQQAMPVIGFLSSRAPGESAAVVTAFRKGMSETGFIEGQNAIIAFRWAEGHYERLPSLASDLVALNVAVFFAAGGPPSALAAKTATSTIPIVFSATSDPVRFGLVASLNRPGGNITGMSTLVPELTGKTIEILREMVPAAAVIAYLINPSNPTSAILSKEALDAASSLGIKIHVLNASTVDQLDEAFASSAKQRPDALVVLGEPFFDSQRTKIVALSARYGLAGCYPWREYVLEGGLLSYGTNLPDSYRQAGVYVGRILKGEKPADLPVQLPTKYELVINLKTAKALSLDIPPTLLARADEVIE
jgi:putative ABC transport system substrate-binding protein